MKKKQLDIQEECYKPLNNLFLQLKHSQELDLYLSKKKILLEDDKLDIDEITSKINENIKNSQNLYEEILKLSEGLFEEQLQQSLELCDGEWNAYFKELQKYKKVNE